MNSDPILHTIGIGIRRTVLFIFLSAALGGVLWGWLLIEWFNLTPSDLWGATRAALISGESRNTSALLIRGCVAIGTLSTCVVYLLIGKWWTGRGDVHRRGARLNNMDAL